MRIKPATMVLIVILGITLLFAGTLFTYNKAKTILVPAVTCGIILVLGAVQLSSELMADAKGVGADIGSSKPVDEEAKKKNIIYITGFGWLIGYAVAIYLIGFIYGTFLFLLLFIRFDGKRSWFKSVTIAILVTAVFWLSFVRLLQTELWGGAVFQWLNLSFPTLTEI